eukprot:Blabericola_migrator_1__4799@NODE_251_length_10854_cov_130_762121_g212_i0_p4_GENE_NODE_251_length_10854_cov_130_762121_g212_i0NODE_251_length_10854_cov_130_762121_g212_i0_p4_ORF_typecomplete_len397_score34_60SLBP_RNA_bind/PF15247_6/6_1e07NICE1/PF15845_5/0_47NICE1/PF15845_5/4_1e03_NODE_251_length_10854_cov_130_762121_g212_i029774167
MGEDISDQLSTSGCKVTEANPPKGNKTWWHWLTPLRQPWGRPKEKKAPLSKWTPWRRGGYHKMEHSTCKDSLGNDEDESGHFGEMDSTASGTSTHCLSFPSRLKLKGNRQSTSSQSSNQTAERSDKLTGSQESMPAAMATKEISTADSQASDCHDRYLLKAETPLLPTAMPRSPAVPSRSPSAQPTLSQALLANEICRQASETSLDGHFGDARTPHFRPAPMSPAGCAFLGHRTLHPLSPPFIPRPVHERTRSLEVTSRFPCIEPTPGFHYGSGRSYDDSGYNRMIWFPPTQHAALPPNYPPRLPSRTLQPPPGSASKEAQLKVKQINQVKNSMEYRIYSSLLPISQRDVCDPQTPRNDPNQDWVSFQNDLREWRLAVGRRAHGLRLLSVLKQNAP